MIDQIIYFLCLAMKLVSLFSLFLKINLCMLPEIIVLTDFLNLIADLELPVRKAINVTD